MKRLITFVLGVGLVTACSASDSVTTRTATTTAAAATTEGDDGVPVPVIVDYSPTVSDVGGFLYLLSDPDVDVVAVSLPATGEAGCGLGAEVTLRILALMGQPDVPVACSEEIPAESHSWPDEFEPGHRGLLAGLPDSDAEIVSMSAPELMAEVAAASETPVVIWAVGPLTNVARALTDHPEMADDIRRIVIMGGAVDVEGSPMIAPAEWNFYIDATAAATVVASGAPITLVPLDATNAVPVPSWYQAALSEVKQSPQIAYLSELILTFPNVTSGFYYFWDELAAVAVTDPTMLDDVTARLSVVVGGGENGRSARDPAGSEVLVATGIDPNVFYNAFLTRLSGEPTTFASGATQEEVAYLFAVAESLDRFTEALGAMFAIDDGPDGSFDSGAMADAFDATFGALLHSHEIVSALNAPQSLVDEHNEYLSTVGEIVDLRTEIVEDIRSSAGTDEELEAIFSRLPDLETACGQLQDKAQLLGVDVIFPCA
ncbi:nucleoside hydrolase [bacterium]|nr:nucleoside hydrolase [bacterium]